MFRGALKEDSHKRRLYNQRFSPLRMGRPSLVWLPLSCSIVLLANPLGHKVILAIFTSIITANARLYHLPTSPASHVFASPGSSLIGHLRRYWTSYSDVKVVRLSMRLLSIAFTCVAIVLPRVAQVTAVPHGGVLSYNIAGTNYKGFTPYNTPVGQTTIQREWDSYDPITTPASGNLACNANGASLGSAQLSATVAAGSRVTAYYNQWPHTIGPVMVYMAKCPGSCTSANPSSLSWFKIDQAGLISGTLTTGLWGQGQLVANNNSWTSTIPASLPAGEYFIRHELLALHTSNQPQFYPECAQLKLTGGGSSSPSGSYLVQFPGAYKASDPGVTIDIYSQPTVTTYTIPGPPVWRG
ncbi:putative glycosyl hydrolase family 61 [Lyophyllum shimeji]|uniref:AA9 family lytic polysaccharide monooxygenase n=1 Tax=Lyophyllum shimeji TaxID=47721 RepID=A0A9P3PKN5_LYOSH|nr:putative glycosyl hydrolase family 61 [Lyophyllum shimeji]